MIKKNSGNLSVSKVFRIFERSRFPVKRYCLRCKYRGLSRLSNGRYYCRRCKYKFSALTNTRLSRSFLPLDHWYELLWWFAYGHTANQTAKEVKLPQQRVHKCFSTIRRAIYDYEQLEMKHLLGQARKDARYADIKNEKRKEEGGRYYRKARTVKHSGEARIQSKPIFCLYELDSRVYVVLRDDIKEQTLREISRGEIVIENDIREDIGKINEKPVDINGVEEFWLYLKEHLVKHHGVSKKHLIYYIKEKEFRFNQRHLRKKGFVEKLIAILVNPGH
ncbi:MAG TPA: hypothetical protein VGA95_13025 [Thermodesulfobacteriota bacterium]